MVMRGGELVLRIQLPRWSLRRWVLTGAALFILGGSAAAYAVIQPFADQQVLKASDLNALVAATNKPVLTKSGHQYSMQATYCGKTAPTNGQITNGYAGAKSLCESLAACGASPSAHMCTAEELVRSAQLSVSIDSGWYSTGVFTGPGLAQNEYLLDCSGWTTNVDTLVGAVWDSAARPAGTSCKVSQPVLCCD
jgi:hypothetical protein